MGAYPVKVLVSAGRRAIERLMRPADRRRLESIATVTWRPDLGRDASEAVYAKAIEEAGADVIVSGWDAPLLTAALWKAHPGVKAVINLTGELKRYVDRDCVAGGLLVTNWGDVPAASVAEAALMMTLTSLRKACYWNRRMHEERGWNRKDDPNDTWTPIGLFDRTVGLYGFGTIARAFADMLQPFGIRPFVFTGWITPEAEARYGVRRVESLKALFSQCDVVSIHTGVRPDTLHSVNAEILAAMPDGGHIVNTARGEIIDEGALLKELRSGRLFAALDVFEQEPLPAEHPFRGLPNCFLQPHHGGPTIDYAARCGTLAVDQVERFARGEPLRYPFTLTQYDRVT